MSPPITEETTKAAADPPAAEKPIPDTDTLVARQDTPASLKRSPDEAIDKVAETASSSKKPRASEVIDVAAFLNYKAGQRFEVEWVLQEREESHWWGATLKEHDGDTTDDGTAIRILDYDPYTEGGYPDRSQEPVLFLDESSLLSFPGGDALHYRCEGEEETVRFDSDSLREQVDGMLVKIVNKQNSKFNDLDHATKGRIASTIAKGKEKLLEAMMDAGRKKTIRAEDIPNIFEQAFGRK